MTRCPSFDLQLIMVARLAYSSDQFQANLSTNWVFRKKNKNNNGDLEIT